jgi:hypothetical protein
MKKLSHRGQVDRNDRSFTRRERHLIARHTSDAQIPESVAEAYDRVQSLVTCDGNISLEQLQGAVEYLLDRVKAARGLNG